MKGHIAKLDFNGDPNIGLYGIATDKFALLGQSVSKKDVKLVEDILKVPVFQVKIYGTDLVGIFTVATSNVILVPDVIFKRELANIKRKLKGIAKVETFDTENTALSNNILLNNKFGFISKEYSKEEVKEVEKSLKVNLVQANFGGLSVPGSIGVLTKNGGIFGSILNDPDIKQIERKTGFEIGLGSVNMGNYLISSGVIANSKGFLVGNLSSGYEIARIDESLGFLK